MLQRSSALSGWFPSTEYLIKPLAAAASSLLRSRACLFTFHRVAPSTTWETLPNRNFYLDLAFLDRLLSYLIQNGFVIVTIEEMLRQIAIGDGDGRYVNFSVDDCYRDTFEDVIPLFRRHGVPVTLFVTTGIPDATLPLWCAGLEDALLRQNRVRLDDGVIVLDTPEQRREAYVRIAGEWDVVWEGKMSCGNAELLRQPCTTARELGASNMRVRDRVGANLHERLMTEAVKHLPRYRVFPMHCALVDAIQRAEVSVTTACFRATSASPYRWSAEGLRLSG